MSYLQLILVLSGVTGVFFKLYKEYTRNYPNFGAAVGMPANIWWSRLVKDCFRSLDSTLKEKTLEDVANDLYFHYTTPQAWEFLPGAYDAIKVCILLLNAGSS